MQFSLVINNNSNNNNQLLNLHRKKMFQAYETMHQEDIINTL